MCGIYAYSGTKNSSKLVLEGLKRLDYRGYDSWGLATVAKNKIIINKDTGTVPTPQKLKPIKGHYSIGHTRWATHGGVTKKNAHPHFSSDHSFALAHNGIIENYNQLKKSLLKAGVEFKTQTDTEVFVRLVEKELKKGQQIRQAIIKAFKKIEGRNAFIVITRSGDIHAVRNGSPLVIGLAKNKQEIFFSSDTLSFASLVENIIILPNNQLASLAKHKLTFVDVKSGAKTHPKPEKLTIKHQNVGLDGYNHYMQKEVHESPQVIQRIIQQDSKQLAGLVTAIKKSRQVYTIGSGTAGIAAAQIAYYLRTIAGIQATNLIGAEASSYIPLITPKDLVIAPSQSGETADVLEVLEALKTKKVPIASHVNMMGSSMTRLSDFKFMAEAGPEICVMSTKVFTSQISWGYLLAKAVAGDYKQGQLQLQNTHQALSKYLDNPQSHKKLKKIAKQLNKSNHIFILGKGQNLQIAREGMVKIIEGTYKHAHAIPAGDLKHYAITIIEKGVPVIFTSSNDNQLDSLQNAVHEVKARGATTIGIAPGNIDLFDHHIKTPDLKETSSIFNTIPLQLLAYYQTVALGNNVDKPRNIAKSVTVK